MKYSLKSAMLNEALVTQQNFISRLIEIIKEKPRAAGIKNCNSYEDIVRSIKEEIDKNSDAAGPKMQIDDLMLTKEEADFYIELKDDYTQKEKNRLNTVDIKKSKGIKLSTVDQTPIVFNNGIFFKKWNKQKALQRVEKNICLEIVKIVEFFEILTNKDKKARKDLEQVVIEQISKHKNIDGTSIELRRILPLYDNMIKYIKQSADVNINDCIKVADLYMKNLYQEADRETIDAIDLGNVDFNKLFIETKYYESFLEEFVLNQTNIFIYEDDNIKITYPTGNYIFNKTIRSYKANVSWCTKINADWLKHTFEDEEYVSIMHVKNVPRDHKDYIISLKIKRDGSVDYDATCDARNIHMNKASLEKYLLPNVLQEINSKVDSVLNKIVYDEDINTEETINIVKDLASTNLFSALRILIDTFFCTTWEPNDAIKIFKTIYENCSPEKRKDFYKLYITSVSEVYYLERNEGNFDEYYFESLFDINYINNLENIQLSIEDFNNTFLEILKSSNSHIKYHISYNELVDKNIVDNISENDFLQIYESAFNTANIDYFNLSLSNMSFTKIAKKYLSLDEITSNNPSPFVQKIKNIILQSRGFKSLLVNYSNRQLIQTVSRARSTRINDINLKPGGWKFVPSLVTSLIIETLNKRLKNIDDASEQNKESQISLLLTAGTLISDMDFIIEYLRDKDKEKLKRNVIDDKDTSIQTKTISDEEYLDICANIFENFNFLKKIKTTSTTFHDEILKIFFLNTSSSSSLDKIIDIIQSNTEFCNTIQNILIYSLENISDDTLSSISKGVFSQTIIAFQQLEEIPSACLERIINNFDFTINNDQYSESLFHNVIKNSLVANRDDNGDLVKYKLKFIAKLFDFFDEEKQRLAIDSLLHAFKVISNPNNSNLSFKKLRATLLFNNLSSNIKTKLRDIINQKCEEILQNLTSTRINRDDKSFISAIDFIAGFVSANEINNISNDAIKAIIKVLYRPINANKITVIRRKYVDSGIASHSTEIMSMINKSILDMLQTAAYQGLIRSQKDCDLFIEYVKECNTNKKTISEFDAKSLLKSDRFVDCSTSSIVEFKKEIIKNLFILQYQKDPQTISNFMKEISASHNGSLSKVPLNHGLRRSAISVIDNEFDKETADMILSSVYNANSQTNSTQLKDPRDMPSASLRRKIRLPGSQSQDQLSSLSSLNPYGDLDDSQNESILRKYIKALLK